MYELKIKNIALAFILTVAGIILAAIINFVPVPVFQITLPLLLIGTIAGFLILNLLLYSKATAIQILKISILNFIIFGVTSFVPLITLSAAGLRKLSFTDNLALPLNPAFLLSCLISSFLAIYLSIEFRSKNTKQEINQETVQENTPTEIAKANNIQENLETKELQTDLAKKISEVSHTVNIDKNTQITETQPVISNKTKSISDITTNEELIDTIPVQELDDTELGILPEINLSGNNELVEDIILNKKEIKNKDIDSSIPENVRLIENPHPRKVETKGRISSIGKLLVNQRDIENIIETNALIQQGGGESERTHIITMASGEKLHKKFEKIKEEYTQIKDMAILDKGGFILSSTFEQEFQGQTTASLVSGAFFAVQNYLSQIDINTPTRIFFKTDEATHSLTLIEEQIFYASYVKDFNFVDIDSIRVLLNTEYLSSVDLNNLQGINGLFHLIMADTNGNIVKSRISENSENIAVIASSIYENLKIFISNIQLAKMQEIIIFTQDKTLTLSKNNDKIFIIITDINGPVNLSGKISAIEDLIRQETP